MILPGDPTVNNPSELVGGNLAADGESRVLNWPGGVGVVNAEGDFGGGTASLQVRYSPAGAFRAVGTDTDFTAAGHSLFELPAGVEIRLSLSGATTPDLDFDIRTVRGQRS